MGHSFVVACVRRPRRPSPCLALLANSAYVHNARLCWQHAAVIRNRKRQPIHRRLVLCCIRPDGSEIDTAKSPKYSRVPSPEEIAAFTGMQCARKYREAVERGWSCHSCGRSAQQLIRWTEMRGPAWRSKFGDAHGMGFTIARAEHHCHGGGRFPRTLICGDCNSADGAVKKKWGLPESWSFSPQELALFVSVEPYSGQTRIDQNLALQIFQQRSAGSLA